MFSTLDAPRVLGLLGAPCFSAAAARIQPRPASSSRFVRVEQADSPSKKGKNRRNKWLRSPSTNYLSRFAGVRMKRARRPPLNQTNKEKSKERETERRKIGTSLLPSLLARCCHFVPDSAQFRQFFEPIERNWRAAMNTLLLVLLLGFAGLISLLGFSLFLTLPRLSTIVCEKTPWKLRHTSLSKYNEYIYVRVESLSL